ncbi:MAG: hypothetical protein KC729_17720, partial [Candidatus Eisenbacteria bacterium]|nr:hypothetical protein [Candidatus Eisenbacteria bacterium]
MSKNRLHPVEQLAAARHLQVIFSMVLVLLGGGIGGNIVGCSSDSSTTQPTGGLSVSITTPAAGPVSGTVSIVASAQDAERVSFLVDGTEIGTDVSAPYFAEWVSTTVADGTHRITAAAINGSERVEAFVDVVVDNTGGGGGGGEVAVSVAPPSASITVGQT